MKHILVYGDSLSWGIVPGTRQRLEFDQRWPGVLEGALIRAGHTVRITENCLNGRRTLWDDPFKAGRKGLEGLSQLIESQSPLDLVILALGVNDFQSMHPLNAWHSAQGTATLVQGVRQAPIEPGMPVPPILIVAPPPLREPQGTMADKFQGGHLRSVGLNNELSKVAETLQCAFFDAGLVAVASPTDGVHLDAPEHRKLGEALCGPVSQVLKRT